MMYLAMDNLCSLSRNQVQRFNIMESSQSVYLRLCEADRGILAENISACDDRLMEIHEYAVCVGSGDLRLKLDERPSV